MSNFGVTYLLKTNVGRNRLSIEDNIGEELHIHFGMMRLNVRNSEFKALVKQALPLISEAADIPIAVLEKLEPIFLFDLCRKGELSSLRLGAEEHVEVGQLFCPVCNKNGIWRYRNIKHSSFLLLMKRRITSTPFDEAQINYYGTNNSRRTKKVLEECKADKNICERYPLFVTDNNVIRDGQHRAAAIYYLYGPHAKVKIQRIETCATPKGFNPKRPNRRMGFRFFLRCAKRSVVRFVRGGALSAQPCKAHCVYVR